MQCLVFNTGYKSSTLFDNNICIVHDHDHDIYWGTTICDLLAQAFLILFFLWSSHLDTVFLPPAPGSVTPVSENQLQTNQAYVLFYQRSNSNSTLRK